MYKYIYISFRLILFVLGITLLLLSPLAYMFRLVIYLFHHSTFTRRVGQGSDSESDANAIACNYSNS